MTKLLRANFPRLFKSFIFRLAMIFSAGLGFFVILMRYIDIKKYSDIYGDLSYSYRSADGLIFVGGLYILFAAAVVIGIFVGTEYSDGTIRNKVIISRSRVEIYLSNLITCSTANIMIHVSYIVVSIIAGNILLEPMETSASDILIFTFAGCLSMIAITAVCLLFSMLIQSKSAASVSILIFVMIAFMATMTISNKLSAPEYYEGFSVVNQETGEVMEVEREKNPNYLTGTKRKVYEILNDFIPSSQLYQIAMEKSDNLGKMAGYSGLICIVSTAVGIFVFRRKNLK